MKLAFLAFLFTSCTHWLIDTQTRIQVENKTSVKIHDFSIVSQTGQIKLLVPDAVKPDSRSLIYEHELAGEFNFVVFSEGLPVYLGVHKLKGGMILVQITEQEDGYTMKIK